jgi:hypothetical protein
MSLKLIDSKEDGPVEEEREKEEKILLKFNIMLNNCR